MKINTKFRIKIIVDLCMAISLPLLMAQALIGEVAHEWIGSGMFVLVIVHNILNRKWHRNLLEGKYSVFRMFQLLLDLAIFFLMIGLMVGGIMLSRHVFVFLRIDDGISFARTLHMLSAYWGFVLMSLHVGLHTNMMLGAMRKKVRILKPSKLRSILLRMTAALLCTYGVYALIHRQIGSYMFLLNQFVFFDFTEPLAFFFMDYIAIMGMLICAGHYLSGALKKTPAKRSVEKAQA